LLLLAVLIAGCSALRLGYRQADIILAWRANTYFDLDAQQKREFNLRIDRLLQWHRYDQLPEYAVFTTAAIDKARHGLTREDIVWFIDGINARYLVIVDHGAGDAADVLATIAPGQIAALQKQFDKDNRKFVSEYELDGAPEVRKRARLKKTLAQIEDWTGNLSREQEQKIAALLDPVPLIERLRHQDRIRRQQEFLELLKLRRDKQEFPPKLHAWLRDWKHGRTPDYEQLSSEVFEKRVQFYIEVSTLLTPGQRQTALKRLQGYVDDFNTLSQKRAAAGFNPTGADKLALF
jgi:hypothetical protein